MSADLILVIEDDAHILQLLKYNLEKEGYSVLTAQDGAAGLQTALNKKPSLILLDLMLPRMDGLEVCKAIRRHAQISHLPVIMLTAKSEELDKVLGLQIGADDYVTKPFSPQELLARVKAMLRRARTLIKNPLLKAGTLELNDDKHIALLKNKPIELTAKEYALLKMLLQAGGKVLSREYLLENVWGYTHAQNIETRTIDMHIRQLRKKLSGESQRIITVKNVGYRMNLD